MTTTESAIRTETFYPHPLARVWSALTDTAVLAAWLMPNDFEPTLGHRFTEDLRGCPRFQAGEESDSCGAEQGTVIRRQGESPPS